MGRSYISVYILCVWSTYRRTPMVTPEIERRLFRYIHGICSKQGCRAIAVDGMPDHVHLLVSIPATITIADLMEQVKGSSSRFASEQLLDGEWFEWQEGYSAHSVSQSDRKVVAAYINNQKRHHAEGTIWPNAERMPVTQPPGDGNSH